MGKEKELGDLDAIRDGEGNITIEAIHQYLMGIFKGLELKNPSPKIIDNGDGTISFGGPEVYGGRMTYEEWNQYLKEAANDYFPRTKKRRGARNKFKPDIS